MKKLILLTLFVPFLGFAQTPKSDKVANDINTAATVIGNMVDLFKKSKNETPNKDNKKSGNTSSNSSTFSINAKPKDIVASVYKCAYKKIDEYSNACVWKPTTAEINKLKQLGEGDYYNDWLNDPKLMFATQVSDSVLTFKQNGIDNIVISTIISSYSPTDTSFGWGNTGGFIRFQTTDGKRMKLVSSDFVLTEMIFAGGDAEILKLDEDNIFYSVKSWEGGTGAYSVTEENIYSLDGKFMLSHTIEAIGNASQIPTEMEIDKDNKLIKLVDVRVTTNKKGKIIKETHKTVATYQYGNGTITEIKKPAAAGKKKK